MIKMSVTCYTKISILKKEHFLIAKASSLHFFMNFPENSTVGDTSRSFEILRMHIKWFTTYRRLLQLYADSKLSLMHNWHTCSTALKKCQKYSINFEHSRVNFQFNVSAYILTNSRTGTNVFSKWSRKKFSCSLSFHQNYLYRNPAERIKLKHIICQVDAL